MVDSDIGFIIYDKIIFVNDSIDGYNLILIFLKSLEYMTTRFAVNFIFKVQASTNCRKKKMFLHFPLDYLYLDY